MIAGRNSIYITIITILSAGYIWIVINCVPHAGTQFFYGGCIIKRLTGIPCPSCGTTRSTILLLHGHWGDALYTNPLGIPLLSLMFILPVWLLHDFVKKSDSLLHFYLKTESRLKQKKIAILFGTLVLTNWLWNIYKGL